MENQTHCLALPYTGRMPAAAKDPRGQEVFRALGNTIVIAVIAVVMSLASWGTSHTAMAAMAGAVALLSFATSIACFRAQADEQEVRVS